MNRPSSSLPISDLTAVAERRNGVQWQFPLPIKPLSAILPAAHWRIDEERHLHPHVLSSHAKLITCIIDAVALSHQIERLPPIHVTGPPPSPIANPCTSTDWGHYRHAFAGLAEVLESSGWRSVNYSRSQNPINYFEICKVGSKKYVFVVKTL
jgi:hypothetical protein